MTPSRGSRPWSAPRRVAGQGTGRHHRSRAAGRGILGLLFGSTSFATDAPNGDVTGGTFLGIEGNGWTFLGFAAAGGILLYERAGHRGAKTMALIVGLVLSAACVIAIVDGNDVFGVGPPTGRRCS